MLRKIINKLWKTDEQEHLTVPVSAKGVFMLYYQDLPIGMLSVNEGKWTFVYSEDFKKQDSVRKLIDFPQVDKVYTSENLWPFFAHRIPGLGQPKVQEIIKKENIDSDNEVDLLRRFGKRSITNPFELAEAAL